MQSNSGLLSGSLITQYAIWLLALLQLILALYVFAINAWQRPTLRRATNYLAASLFILAANTFAEGWLVEVNSIAQATLPTILLAISAPAIPVVLLLSSISLLRFNLLHPSDKAISSSTIHHREHLLSGILRWGAAVLILLPLLFTLIDLLLSRFSITTFRLWYSGITAGASFSGGYIPRDAYINGLLEPLVIGVNFIGVNLLTLGFLLREAIKPTLSPSTQGFDRARRTLVWLLLIAISVTAFFPGLAIGVTSIQAGNDLQTGAITTSPLAYIAVLVSNALVTGVFAFSIFRRTLESSITEEKVQEETKQTGWGTSLQTRLVSATIVVVLPLLAAMGIMLTRQAQSQLELNAAQTLTQLNRSLGDQVLQWLDSSILALQNVADSPTIRSMYPPTQQAMLDNTARNYPDFYLISTLTIDGMNLARSDHQAARDYSSQTWFQKASASGEAGYQPMVGKDIWKPDLVIIVPIRSETNGPILGYLMAISTLNQVSTHFQDTRLGEQGFALLVDDQNRLLAHPDWAQTIIQTQYGLQDMTSHPPVAALPAVGSPSTDGAELGAAGMFRFNDDSGAAWQAAMRRLDNGWGLIVQQREDELLAPIAAFQRIALIVLLAGVAMLIPLMLLTVRNSLLPVQKLTETARAIAAGNLGQLAPLEIASEPGEIGLLAGTFNNMTLQLRQLIGGLEQRVADRTQAVQRRAVQLQVTAEVAREAASIRDPEELLRNISNLISERFGFYHAGLFLVQRSTYAETEGTEEQGGEAASSDSYRSGGYAILQAASSEGGQRMLARHHRLKVGPAGSGVGIVGYVAHAGLPRIALDVGSDAVFFNNPDLPLTRSEMALPLMVAAADGKKSSTKKGTARRVIGVLDVQSTQEAAFGQEDIEILQILADQVAVALENARLLSESRQALEQLQQVYGERIRQSWQDRLRRARAQSGAKERGREATPEITYTFDSSRLRSVTALQDSALPVSLLEEDGTKKQSDQQSSLTTQGSFTAYRLTAQIELRGQKLGQLVLQRDKPWSREEHGLIRETMDQVALAVENARLLEEIQQRAFQEELVSQMVSQTQRSLDLETVMRSVVQEIAQAMPVERIQLQLMGGHSSTPKAGNTPPAGGGGENASIS